MANDAKLGLVLGVALVVIIGLVYFRGDPASARMPIDPARATAKVNPVAPQTNIASR